MSDSCRCSTPAADSPAVHLPAPQRRPAARSAEAPRSRPRQAALAAGALVLALALPGTARAGVDHWTRPAAAPPDFSGLAVDPCRPDVVYGVNRGEGVFLSHDLGRTWVAVRNGLTSVGPPLVAVPACEPGRAAPLWSLGGYPAFRSEDGGGSWTPAWDVPGLATGGLGHLAVAPAFPRVVYADAGGSIVRSEDGGHTWATIYPDFYVTSVAVSPDDSDRVYALWEPEVGGPRLLVSRDGGRDPAGWDERPTPWTGHPWPGRIDDLAVAPGDPDRLWLIGADDDGRFLWTSADGGTTWRRHDAVPFRAPRLLAFDFTVAGRFLVASDDGLFETRDGGASWRDRSRHRLHPLPAGAAIAALQVDPRRPARLWVSVEGEGVFLNRGRGWEARSGRPVPPFELLAADPGVPDRLWAVDAGPNPRLRRSTNGGAHWADAGAVPPSRRYFDLHVDRSDGATLLLATAEALHRRPAGGPWQAVPVRGWNDDFPRLEQELAPAGSPATLYAGAGAFVWASTDGGATWQDHLLPTGAVLALCPGWQPGELIVLTSHTVWRTDDRGASWRSAGVLSNRRVSAPAVADPTRPGILHAATEEGLWTSRDHGATWSATPLPVPLGTVESLVVTPTGPGTLYVSADREVWRSRDAGATWEAAGAGLFGVPRLVADPADPAHLLALSWNGLLDARFVDAPPVYLGVGGRFRVSAAWYDGSGPGTAGRATSAPGWRLGDEGAVFRFAGPDNPEVAVKLLDGRGVNGHFWWFATSLTHRHHELTVVDRASGVVATRVAASLDTPATEDLRGFPAFPGLGDAPPPTAAPLTSPDPGTPDPVAGPAPASAAGGEALDLAGGRFRLELLWRDQAGASGAARAVPFSDGWGHFEIFRQGRMELVVKVLDGRPVNGAYWLFAGPLTHLELWLVVTDTETGERRVHRWGLGERHTLVDLDLPG